MLDAITEMFIEERDWTKQQLENIDGNALLRSAAMTMARENLKSIRARFEPVGTRKSETVKGHPPASLKRHWEGSSRG
ncbi:hypothetical protein IQ782_15595 [Salipiger pacificus]|uniref:Uncharacterized protein n=1 Tax=Salipiger mangrovisoli TaxID=2865933 RepID=A0ABR9X3Y5_9RHOB|nr:hypothetical protein [Salipiger mangrovisoli]